MYLRSIQDKLDDRLEMMEHFRDDITIIDVANSGKRLVYVFSNATDMFVLLVYRVSREEMGARCR